MSRCEIGEMFEVDVSGEARCYSSSVVEAKYFSLFISISDRAWEVESRPDAGT